MSVAAVLGPIGNLADHARLYGEAGLAVFPVKPADKTPLVSQYNATTDPTQIGEWWQRWPKALIGHRIAPDQIILDVDPRHGGDVTWKNLRANAQIPQTRRHMSGREDGGGHTWWLRPSDKLSVAKLDAWAKDHGGGHAAGERWTGGIDVLQHNHRYTILPPSPHPETGQPYRWADGYGLDAAVMPLPQLFVDLLVDDTPPAPVTPPRPPQPDSILDWYSANHRLSDLLPAHGWTLVGGDGDSDGSRWRHPTATSAMSATVRHGCLFVYSPNTPLEVTAPSDPHGYTVARAWAVLEHRGDLSAAAKAAREMKDGVWFGDGALERLVGSAKSTGESDADTTLFTDWHRVDLAPYLNGTLEPPAPTILAVTGHPPLIYPGTVNSFFGESGAGKTWVTLAAIQQVLDKGGSAILVDLEDSPHGIMSRLTGMGLSSEVLVPRFGYISPSTAWRPDAAGVFAEIVTEMTPELVVIDSTGEAMAMAGVKGNDDDDVARWFSIFPRFVARFGPAVLLTDHIPKDPNAPGGYAIGSQRKRAAIDGASYRIDAVIPPDRHREGLLKVVTAKDRHGTRSAGTVAIEVRITPNETGTKVTIEPPSGGDPAAGEEFRPTVLMERVSEFVAENSGCSRRMVERDVPGKGAFVRAAIDCLVREDFLEQTLAAGRKSGYELRSLRPFSQLSDMTSGTASYRVPTASRTRSTPDVTASLTGGSPRRGEPEGRGTEDSAVGPGSGVQARPDETTPSTPTWPHPESTQKPTQLADGFYAGTTDLWGNPLEDEPA